MQTRQMVGNERNSEACISGSYYLHDASQKIHTFPLYSESAVMKVAVILPTAQISSIKILYQQCRAVPLEPMEAFSVQKTWSGMRC